ncbi:MAG: trigger factor [Candidatus Thermochlorobacter aerophilum]|uniref:Trigger factor n=1 Tax=Candidatus Thermochlorobacter aerophilus TaxID=1868324 RepID=A0A395M508_9BACT|nr:MAG: trigger factor [Candidatus Thermochlorobacter aerophilum]
MDNTITSLSATQQEMTLTLEPSEFTPVIEARFKEVQANAQIKGFRKGKVPMELVRRLMGKEIEADAVEFLANKFFSAVAEEKKLKIVGKAHLRHFEYAPDQRLKIYVQYEVQPEFELKPYDNYSFTKIVYQITDADVDVEVKALLAQHGAWVSKDGEAEDEDLVIADMQKLDATGTAIIGGRRENQEFFLGELDDESALKKALLGVKVGDERDIDIEMRKEDGTAERTHFRIFVKEIKRLDLPELTDELAKELSNGRCTTAQDLRNDIRQALEKYYAEKSEEDLLEDIAQRFVKDNVVEVPSAMVRSFENLLVDNTRQRMGGSFPRGFSEEAFRREIRPSAELQARWMLIRYKLAEMHNLKVEEDDIRAEAEKDAKASGLDVNQLLRAYTSNQMREYIADRILRQKIYDVIKSKVTINTETKPIPRRRLRLST